MTTQTENNETNVYISTNYKSQTIKYISGIGISYISYSSSYFIYDCISCVYILSAILLQRGAIATLLRGGCFLFSSFTTYAFLYIFIYIEIRFSYIPCRLFGFALFAMCAAAAVVVLRFEYGKPANSCVLSGWIIANKRAVIITLGIDCLTETERFRLLWFVFGVLASCWVFGFVNFAVSLSACIRSK